MPGKGHAFQITREWQDLVHAKMKEKGLGLSELAKQAKMAKSSLSTTLKPGAIQTTKMPAINKVLGIAQPLDKPTPAVQEGANLLGQLPPLEQGRWLERIRQAVEQTKK